MAQPADHHGGAVVGRRPAPTSPRACWPRSLAPTSGSPWYIENRTGANGSVGADADRQGASGRLHDRDFHNTYLTFNPSIYASLQYDSLKDFTPIALASYVPNILVVNAQLSSKDIKSLIAELKAQPSR